MSDKLALKVQEWATRLEAVADSMRRSITAGPQTFVGALDDIVKEMDGHDHDPLAGDSCNCGGCIEQRRNSADLKA